MAEAIRFYFDFASPYAYFASREIEKVAADCDRSVEWRPVLLWAVLKAHAIAPPMDAPVKRDYFFKDMARSARFYGLPYEQPAKFPLSSHLAARLFHFIDRDDSQASITFARRVFSTFFVEGVDISDETVMTELASEVGLSSELAKEGMKGPQGRALLESAVSEAIADGVIGSPFFIADGEKYFGADRLSHLARFLKATQK